MKFSLKLDIHQPPRLFEWKSPSCINRTRNPVTSLTLSNDQDSNGSVKLKPAKSEDVHGIWGRDKQQQLVNILQRCAVNSSLVDARTVHGFVLRSCTCEDSLVVLLNHIAHAYSKCSDIRTARLVFDHMFKRNVFSWTVMISGSSDNGLFLDSLQFFHEMLEEGVSPDKFAYSATVQLCIGLGSIELGKIVHSQIIRAGFSSNTFISTSLLSMYAKLGYMEESRKVFDSMIEHNEVSWNAIISGYTSNGLYSEAYEYFLRMKHAGEKPNVQTFISLLKAVGKLADIDKGRHVHDCVLETGMESNVSVGTALIDMHARSGSICDAMDVFRKNFMECPVSAPWNAMISAYSHCGMNREAMHLYTKMCHMSIESDTFTCCSVFDSIASLKNLSFAKEVHGKVLKSGSNLMVTDISNAIADAYAKCGSLEDVEKIFKQTSDKNLVSWTTMLTAYSQCSEEIRALSFFSQMIETGFLPNEYTYSSVLAACSSLSFLEFGQQVHGLICKASMDEEKCVQSALIDMYAKCGCITDASLVFERIHEQDIVTWSSMISGYALHGSVESALGLFKQMETKGFRPNSVVFLSVLFACSHGGLVEEGLRYFDAMKNIYGIIPEMQHYACIVDLLGRVGRLDDAMEFIKKMPSNPDEKIWQSLLGSCRKHGNIELGKVAAEKIVSVRPEDPSVYVLLSNTYFQSGKLDGGVGLRDMMKDMGMKKEPGVSWISVNGKVHKFYARDQEHPEKNEIYGALEELRAIMKPFVQGNHLNCGSKDLQLMENHG